MSRKLDLPNVCSLFEVKEIEAAGKLNCSVTTLKKFCRKSGIDRWPYRKVKALNRQINLAKERMKDSSDNMEYEQAANEKRNFERQRTDLLNPERYRERIIPEIPEKLEESEEDVLDGLDGMGGTEMSDEDGDVDMSFSSAANLFSNMGIPFHPQVHHPQNFQNIRQPNQFFQMRPVLINSLSFPQQMAKNNQEQNNRQVLNPNFQRNQFNLRNQVNQQRNQLNIQRNQLNNQRNQYNRNLQNQIRMAQMSQIGRGRGNFNFNMMNRGNFFGLSTFPRGRKDNSGAPQPQIQPPPQQIHYQHQQQQQHQQHQHQQQQQQTQTQQPQIVRRLINNPRRGFVNQGSVHTHPNSLVRKPPRRRIRGRGGGGVFFGGGGRGGIIPPPPIVGRGGGGVFHGGGGGVFNGGVGRGDVNIPRIDNPRNSQMLPSFSTLEKGLRGNKEI